MFGELPKLFDRNFAIGYFLPVAIFLIASFNLLSNFNLPSTLLLFTHKDVLLDTTLLGLVSWLCGILLLALNRDIYRFFEGYGILNPLRLFAGIERRSYKRLNLDLDRLKDYRKELDEKLININNELDRLNTDLLEPVNTSKQEKIKKAIVEATVRKESFYKENEKYKNMRAKLSQQKAERFPDNERWLLPTAFGNTIRAFEVYSRVIYGLDAIPGWERLLTVIPKDYRTLIDDAKAQTDFWVNFWLFSLIFLFEYITILLISHQYKFLWILPISILLAFITSFRARMAALEWGHYIKSSFDVFLPELYKKLELRHPLDREEERKNFARFSQTIIYRSKSSIHSRVIQKSKEKKED